MRLFLDLEVWSNLRKYVAVRDDGGERNHKRHNDSDIVKLHTIKEVHELAASYYMADCLVSIV
jgi:hypothetical protein